MEVWELHEDVLGTADAIGITKELADRLLGEGLVVETVVHVYKINPDAPARSAAVRIEEVIGL